MTAELSGLTVHIDTGRWRETVLTDVDIAVPAGRITAVLGGPGAGKTMVASALTGRLPNTARHQGLISINGQAVDGQHWQSLRERIIGYVPQDGVTAFDPHQTVGAQLQTLQRRHRAWSVERACAAAQFPTETLDLLPQQHSGGQIQRAALAAALLPAPPVLIADGPTNSLDMGTAYGVWRALRDYADSGAAVLVVSNEVRILAHGGFADRMVVLHEGRVLAAGTTAELTESTDTFVQAILRARF